VIQIIQVIKAHLSIEASVIVSVRPFNLPVVSRSIGTNRLVFDTKILTETLHEVHFVRFMVLNKLGAVVCLDDLWKIAEIKRGPFKKQVSGVRGFLLIRIDEPLTRTLIDDGVLIEAFIILS